MNAFSRKSVALIFLAATLAACDNSVAPLEPEPEHAQAEATLNGDNNNRGTGNTAQEHNQAAPERAVEPPPPPKPASPEIVKDRAAFEIMNNILGLVDIFPDNVNTTILNQASDTLDALIESETERADVLKAFSDKGTSPQETYAKWRNTRAVFAAVRSLMNDKPITILEGLNENRDESDHITAADFDKVRAAIDFYDQKTAELIRSAPEFHKQVFGMQAVIFTLKSNDGRNRFDGLDDITGLIDKSSDASNMSARVGEQKKDTLKAQKTVLERALKAFSRYDLNEAAAEMHEYFGNPDENDYAAITAEDLRAGKSLLQTYMSAIDRGLNPALKKAPAPGVAPS